MLKTVQVRAAEAGVNLDVGEFPKANAQEAAAADPAKPVNLTAHMVARVADRFSFVRKFSRQLEGSDKKAGLLSDLIATVIALYERNPELVNELGGKAKQEFAARQQARAAANPGSVNQQEGM